MEMTPEQVSAFSISSCRLLESDGNIFSQHERVSLKILNLSQHSNTTAFGIVLDTHHFLELIMRKIRSEDLQLVFSGSSRKGIDKETCLFLLTEVILGSAISIFLQSIIYRARKAAIKEKKFEYSLKSYSFVRGIPLSVVGCLHVYVVVWVF